MLKIGPYRLSAIETGEFALDGGAMFGVIPKPLWEKRIPVDARNRIDMRLRALLIQGEGKNILVDTGIGDKGDTKFNDIYRVDHSRYTLESSLAKKGLKPEDITDVVITHLHFDHVGGATKYDSEGNLVPTFPNAIYHIQKRHLEWARSATERDMASFRKEDFMPLVEQSRVNLLEGETELYPGITVRLSNGHTTCQQHVLVSDGKESLFYCGDLIPTSVHVSLPWIMGYDIKPLTTLEEKKSLLDEAVEKNYILFFEHCPHMAAAHVGTKLGKYIITSSIL
jgi:glyoxylase-like metal-dependent hydrolase (beta-lactamase superfamily II)